MTKAGILVLEHVDLPDPPGDIDAVSHLVDQMSGAQFEQRLGIGDRDGILEFMAAEAALGCLDGERGARPVDHPHPHAGPAFARQIALPKPVFALHPVAPAIACHQELTLDLRCHRCNRAIQLMTVRLVAGLEILAHHRHEPGLPS
jgi:hypothetical protein